MASPFAIPAVGKAILAMLAQAVPRAELDGAPFELIRLKDLQAPMQEGIGLYLYRITPASSVHRNLPSRTPALQLDLHYLLVAWAGDAFKQQRLLGWAMHTLARTPVLPAALLNAQGPEPDLFAGDEAVEVVPETLSIQDLASVWGGAIAQMQPSAAYLVRNLSLA